MTFMQGICNYVPETSHVSNIHIYIMLQLFCGYNLWYI